MPPPVSTSAFEHVTGGERSDVRVITAVSSAGR
jgi:hypothetical protein